MTKTNAPLSDTPEHRLHLRRTLGLLAGLALVLHLDQFLLGPYAFVNFYDTLEVHLGPFLNMGRLLEAYGLFSWFPMNSGGAPSFVGQHPPYALPVLLGMALPYWVVALAWQSGIVLALAYGGYRFLREFLRVHEPVALFVASMACLTLVGGNVHFLFTAVFPLVFAWTLDLADPATRPWGRAWRVAAILALFLASYPVLTLPHFPVFHLALVLLFGRDRADFRRLVAVTFLVWTGYVLLFVPTIYSLFQSIPHVQRDWQYGEPGLAEALADYAFKAWRRLAAFPLLPLLLLGLPLFRTTRRLRLPALLFLAPWLISVAFQSKLNAFLARTFLVKLDLFLSSSLIGLSLAALGALVLHEYHSQRRMPGRYAILAAVLVILSLKSEYVMVQHGFFLGAGLSFLAVTVRLREASDAGRRRMAVLALSACLVGAALMVRQNHMTGAVFVPYAKGYAGHEILERLAQESKSDPFRVAEVDVHASVLQANGLDTVGQKAPLFDKYFKQYVKGVVRPQLADPRLDRWFDTNWRYLFLTRSTSSNDFTYRLTLPGAPQRKAGDFNLPLLAAMNVRYLVSSAPILDMEAHADYLGVDTGRGAALLAGTPLARLYELPLHVYRLHGSNPRGFFAPATVARADAASVLALMELASPEALRSTAYLIADQMADVPGQAPTGIQGRAELLEWTPDRLAYSVTADAPGHLVVLNNMHPQWSATVNGQPAPLLRSNVAFQAVPVQAGGPFEVRLEFRTPEVWWLHLASLLGVLLVVAAARPAAVGAAPPLTAPDRASGTALLAPAMAGALLTSLLWAALFYAFTLARKGGGADPSLTYCLVTNPVMGLMLGLWATRWTDRLR